MSGIKLDSSFPKKVSFKVSRTSSSSSSTSESSSSGHEEDDENDNGDNAFETSQLFEEHVQPPLPDQSKRQKPMKHPQQQQQQQEQRTSNRLQPKNAEEQLSDYVKRKHTAYKEEKAKNASVPSTNNSQFAAWEKHSNKYGSKMFTKWGYAGGGLGKEGTGITSPIKAKPSPNLTDSSTWSHNTTLIVGDSMINGIEEDRLRRYNARVVACPGAKIKDMYEIITPLLTNNPSKVIVHVGTNDCPYKPSDVIINDLNLLRKYIENNLPGGKVVISCPIMRTDNKLANSTIRNIAVAMDSMPNTILNNKINAFCLGKKGLHLNKKGSGKLALNFISKMQCV